MQACRELNDHKEFRVSRMPEVLYMVPINYDNRALDSIPGSPTEDPMASGRPSNYLAKRRGHREWLQKTAEGVRLRH